MESKYKRNIHEMVAKANAEAEHSNIFMSICIPSHNRAPLVEKLVKQCLSLIPDEDVEVIVGNHGSEDDTEDRLLTIKDSRFHYYYFDEEENEEFLVNMLALGHGKWCMELTDKDEFVQLDWPTIRKTLENAGDAVMFKGAYYTGEGTPLVLPPPKVYEGGYAETYSFLMATCSYATNTIVRREEYVKAMDFPYNRKWQICQAYSHVCRFAVLMGYGSLAPMAGFVLKRQFATESPEARKFYAGYGFNKFAPKQDPYWTPFSRLEQHTEWMKLFCPMIKSPEEKIQMVGGLMFGLLNIIVDYYEKIHSPNIPGIHFHRPETLERDHHRPSADWRNFFWHAYLRFISEMSQVVPGLSALNVPTLVQVANIYQRLNEKITAVEKS